MEVNCAKYCLFDFSDFEQTHNRWGDSILRDASYLASLRQNNLDMFILRPFERENTLLALLERRNIGEFLKSKLIRGN